jgi:hypothetical protein
MQMKLIYDCSVNNFAQMLVTFNISFILSANFSFRRPCYGSLLVTLGSLLGSKEVPFQRSRLHLFKYLFSLWSKLLIVITVMNNQKSSLFWDITPCSPLKIKRRFRRSYPSFFKVKEEAEQDISEKQVASRGLISRWFFFYVLILGRWRRCPETLFAFNRLHGVVSQNSLWLPLWEPQILWIIVQLYKNPEMRWIEKLWNVAVIVIFALHFQAL